MHHRQAGIKSQGGIEKGRKFIRQGGGGGGGRRRLQELKELLIAADVK